MTAAPLQSDIARQARAHAFHRAPAGLASIGLDGCVVEVNDALTKVLAVDPSELVGHHMAAFVLPEYLDRAHRWMARAQVGVPDPFRVDSWYQCGDGVRRWLRTDGTVVTDEAGAPSFVMISVQDQTAEKLTHDELRRSNEELDAILASSPVPIYGVDANGVVRLWNAAAGRVFGWMADEVIGRPLPIVNDDQRPEFEALLSRVLGGEAIEGVDIVRHRRDGTAVAINMWASPIRDLDGSPIAAVAVSLDVTERRRAETVLRADEHRFRTLVNNISDTITVLARDGRVLSTTGEVNPILGYPTEGFWGDANFFDMLHPDDREMIQPVIAHILSAPGNQGSADARIRDAAGEWVRINGTAVNLLDDPAVGGLVVTTRNVEAQKRAEELIADQSAILEMIARGRSSPDVLDSIAAMVETHARHPSGVFLAEERRLHPRSARHVSRRAAAAIAALPGALVIDDDKPRTVTVDELLADPLTADVGRALVEDGSQVIRWTPVPGPGGHGSIGAIGTFAADADALGADADKAAQVGASLVAIVLDRHASEARLAHQTLHDDLTGLPNRTLLLDRLETARTRARRVGGEVAVLFVDIDMFKVVNDSLGQPAGDQVLVEFARRLGTLVRPGDTVARYGADEFVVVCDQPGALTIILAVADRLSQALKAPFAVEDDPEAEIFLTASLGLALGVEPDGATLLRNADAAMSRAKKRGRNRLEVYDAAMQSAALERLELGNSLRRALERSELTVVYQPVVELESGVIVGVEALARWQHPSRGAVPPSVFILLAEETGAIKEIGDWVLRESISELSRVIPEEARPALAVNVSARQLGSHELISFVGDLLVEFRWPAHKLTLELTETALTDDVDVALQALVRLRATGVRIAIDDFGTGYSSLTHLQRFPIDVVKIDRSFVAGLGEPSSGDRGAIAEATLGMARALGLTAVAEGVETRAQLEALRHLGCAYAQGYLFAPPMPAEALSEVIRMSPQRPV